MLRCAIPSRRDRDCDEVSPFVSQLPRSVVFRSGRDEPANLFPLNTKRARQLHGNHGGDDGKNICSRAFHRGRIFRPNGSARGSVECETAGDQPLRLPFRANSKAREEPPTRDRVAYALRKFATLHRYRVRDRSRPARERADMIAETIAFALAIPIPSPSARPAAASNAYR